MANVIKKATNKFTKGLVMDFSPENTKNEVLTNALNATLLTFNGNELSLQNDMGNARVESAFLPEGYIPVGTCEYGGIVYIVSYNPLEDKSQIGCFPSPERNISRKEMGRTDEISVNYTDFQETQNGDLSGDLKNTTYKVLLRDSNLNPGDKFIVYSNDSIYEERIQNMFKSNAGVFSQTPNPLIKISLVSIQDNGKIVYLNSDVRQYEVTKMDGNNQEQKFKYHILGQVQASGAEKPIDVDTYRNVLSSGYSVFKEKTSGKLAILAELVTIDTFSLTHSIMEDGHETEDGIDYYKFKVVLHPEISPVVTTDTFDIDPKLKYYYIKQSEGKLQAFYNNELIDVYYSTVFDNLSQNLYLFNNKDVAFNNYTGYILTTNDMSLYKSLEKVKTKHLNMDWKEIYSNIGTYYSNLVEANLDDFYYIKVIKDNYYVLHKSQLSPAPFMGLMYALDYDKDLDKYSLGSQVFRPVGKYNYYAIKAESTNFTFNKNFINKEYNYIENGQGQDKKIEEESAFQLYKSDYLTNKNDLNYEDILFASFRLPKLLVDQGISLPFKYDYTIVPCMEYGKLDYLAASNTVDLNNLYNFNASKFTTWKYRIDNNQLTLTVGSEIFDTFEQYKVDGLFLEFYDWRGFAGSVEISGKKSYSGKFTKIIPLNTLKAISNKKINYFFNEDGSVSQFGKFIDTYERNVNIIPDGTVYKLNNETVEKRDDVYGWNYVKTENGNKVYTSLSENNDCGTLYSNLIYVIQPYFRITENDKQKFIKKDTMFLFTFPIYNDYYYNIDNFNTLVNPKLDMVLTYRLEDFSDVVPYQQAQSDDHLNIIDGYDINHENWSNVENYRKGVLNDDVKYLNTVRYFQYKGTSKLQLEIGLLKDYENYNLSCDPTINNAFTCQLSLINNNGDSSFTCSHKETNKDVLNHTGINTINHYLKFKDGNGSDYLIDNYFNTYNFINNGGNQYIDISYNFVVGYNISIDDIKRVLVPSTTVSALYHLDGDSYNNDDFNVYELKDGDTSVYLPNAVIYNSGTQEEQLFGLCKMVDITGQTMPDQCSSYKQYSGDVKPITMAGKLNSGDPLKYIADGIGKLSFCQPHAHGLFASSVTSLTGSNVDGHISGNSVDGYIINNPKYNMCVNTPNSINNYTEFISVSPNVQTFSGLTIKEIAKFTRCMLNTMKCVYAFNPDYNQISVNSGNVLVEDFNLSFTSNIISKNASITTDRAFNDYLKLGSVTFSDYFEQLSEHSAIEGLFIINAQNKRIWCDNINFTPNLTYCGGENNEYLISSLTYNIPIPNQIYDDLQIDLSKQITVIHHDGSLNFITGDLDKNALYGWYSSNSANKLVSLDVSNYSINQDTGELSIIDTGKFGMVEQTIDVILTKSEGGEKPDSDYLMLSGNTSKTVTRQLPDGTDISFKVSTFINTSQYQYFGQERCYNNLIYEYSDYRYNNPDYLWDVWTYYGWDYSYEELPSDYSSFYYSLRVETENSRQKLIVSNVDMEMQIRYIHSESGYMKPDKYGASFNDVYLGNIPKLQENREYEHLGGYKHVYGLHSLFCNLNSIGTPTYSEHSALYAKTVTVDYQDIDYNFIINNGSRYQNAKDVRYTDKIIKSDPQGLGQQEYQCFCELPDLIGLKSKALCIARCKTPRFKLTVQKFKHLSDFEEQIINLPKTTNYGLFENKQYVVKTYNDGATPTLVGSTLTINDLVYYPEIDKHRLFIRNLNYRSDSITDRNPILYRDLDHINYEESKNALRLYKGPGYKTKITLNDTDPENVIHTTST